jgi:hypothetical protein
LNIIFNKYNILKMMLTGGDGSTTITIDTAGGTMIINYPIMLTGGDGSTTITIGTTDGGQ